VSEKYERNHGEAGTCPDTQRVIFEFLMENLHFSMNFFFREWAEANLERPMKHMGKLLLPPLLLVN